MMSNENSSQQDFHSSELGTLQYWDDTYTRELQAFQEVGDVGEIWFGEEVQDRMVRWVTQKSDLPPSAPILDLGCGNGMLLLALREEDFTDLTGADYSEGAIQLARSIAEKEGVEDIKFEVCDILDTTSTQNFCQRCLFALCLDKGTYDAISLRDGSVEDDRRSYSRNVKSLLQKSGLFVITSCNWTKEQLAAQFSEDFELYQEIPAPKFTFGGKSGQTVTTLIFKRKDDGT